MSAFQRSQRRMDCLGVQLTRPMDNCAPGKWPILQNVRSVVSGSIQARQGLIPVPGASFGNPIHTVVRFDDTSPFATYPNLYVIGTGPDLYEGAPNAGFFGLHDTGYSGAPLSITAATPPQSPQPYLYIADPSRMRKANAQGDVWKIGITPPITEPAPVLQPLGLNIIEQLAAAGNTLTTVGAQTTIAAPPVVARVNTTIGTILYDSGSTGYASIAPVAMAGIDIGALLTVNGSQQIAVTDLLIAIAATTIAGILYDAGSTGLCTIQPAASLGTGQLEAPNVYDYRTRYFPAQEYAIPRGSEISVPGTAPIVGGAEHARIRQIDFPVDCLVRIGGSETVRVLSVALGKDGVQSFRCLTTGAHVAGESLAGLAGFRASLTGATAGATLTDYTVGFVITPVVPSPLPVNAIVQATGGMRTGAGFPAKNLSQINGRATLPDDDVHLSIRADLCAHVNTVRVYFSVYPTAGTAPSGADFTDNYFFFEWRQNDIITAIQTANAQDIASLQSARATAQQNAITNAPIRAGRGGAAIVGQLTPLAPAPPPAQRRATPAELRDLPGAAGISGDATSEQLALGNNQWLELHCKVSDLVRVGTDTSLTLASVTAAEVLVNVVGQGAVTIDLDAIWLSGGFGPDVGSLGVPYVYAYRYRSSITGGTSNPSPFSRGGVIPRRQQILVSGTASADPQVDLVDWFKLGGSLTAWTYTGTTPNDGSVFADVFEDGSLSGGETLAFDRFPPWPTEDIAHRGTCTVAGSAIRRTSGDAFNTSWAPGSIILVNNQAYTLYAQPISTSLLFINENAGSGSGLSFTLPSPTLMNQNFGSIWGGPIAGAVFNFACRNPINAGRVAWTHGNDPETASDKNTLDITTPSDPLQAGFMWDGVSFVASTEQLYALEPTQDPAVPFRPIVTPCGRGFWSPWAYAMAPEGVYFLAKDGIFLTSGGGAAVSITDEDLYPLFPHNGIAGQPVNGYLPVYMGASPITAPRPAGAVCATFNCGGVFYDPRLAYIDGWVIFDYSDTSGTRRTLSYHVASKSWWPDQPSVGLNMHEGGVGLSVHEQLIGGLDGQLYVQGGLTDGGTAYHAVATFVDNQADARRVKLYRDLFLKGDLTAALVTVGISLTDGTNVLPPALMVGVPGFSDYVINTVPQQGIYGTNLTVQLSWAPATSTSPLLNVWDIAYQFQSELASSWLSGPTTHGFRGFQQVQRALIAYLSVGPVTLSVIIDGVLYTYALPSTGGQYAKEQVILQSVKGKTFQWGLQSSPFHPFLLWDADCEFWIQQWAAPGSYQIVKPF